MEDMWTIYLQSKEDPSKGRKVDVKAKTMPAAQKKALAMFKKNEYKLYGYPDDYLTNTKD